MAKLPAPDIPSVDQAAQPHAVQIPSPIVPRERQSRSWMTLDFSGYEADDTRSSLLRLWKGILTAVRSDGHVIRIPISSEQADTPFRVGQDIVELLSRLETYRNCQCKVGVSCSDHTQSDPILFDVDGI